MKGPLLIYEFTYGSNILAMIQAEGRTAEEARLKAISEADIFCDRPHETPYERMLKLRYADVKLIALGSYVAV